MVDCASSALRRTSNRWTGWLTVSCQFRQMTLEGMSGYRSFLGRGCGAFPFDPPGTHQADRKGADEKGERHRAHGDFGKPHVAALCRLQLGHVHRAPPE